MRTRIFATTILPEHIIAKNKLSFAACNFSSNLISGNGFDKVYSTMPVYVGGEMDADAFADDRFELLYDSFRKRGGLFQKIAAFKEQFTLFRKIPRGASIWFYNLYVLNFLTVILLRLFKPSVQVNVIELDFTPPTKRFSLDSLYLWLLNRSNGIIKLSDSPLFTNKNSVCLPGVTPVNQEAAPSIDSPKLVFLLSGELQPNISSLPMILEAFSKVPNCILHVVGTEKFKIKMQEAQEYSIKFSNIIYHDSMRFADYLNLLHNVTFQLSLRNPDWADNMCNFPSKIIEALLHNRGIVSTIAYTQLKDINFITTERSVEGFIATLEEISGMSSRELSKYVNQGEKVSKAFSAKVWNDYMNKIENHSI